MEIEKRIVFFREDEVFGSTDFGEPNGEDRFELTDEFESSVGIVLVKGIAMTALDGAKTTCLMKVLNKLKEKAESYLSETDYITSKYLEEVLIKGSQTDEFFKETYKEQFEKRAECREILREVKSKGC